MDNSNKDNRAAGDTIHPPAKVNSLQALIRLRPKHGHEWCVLAFVLNRDIIKQDGTLDDLYGMVFLLGSFKEQTDAEEHAKNIIALTGHPFVIPVRYAYPFRLSTQFDPATVTEVSVDTKGKLIELESADYKRQRQEFEKRVKIERDIMKEAEEETDPDSIEHFKRQCYLAIKNRSVYNKHCKEAEVALQNYRKRESAVRDHYNRHPEHEEQWLPYLKEKLIERGEMDLYNGLANAYKEIREEILGLQLVDDPSVIELKQTIADQNSVILDLTKKLARFESKNVSIELKDDIKCECGDICLGLKSDDTSVLTIHNNSEASESDDDIISDDESLQ